jgi:hypothetical protein
MSGFLNLCRFWLALVAISPDVDADFQPTGGLKVGIDDRS